MPKIDALPTDTAPATTDLVPFVDVDADRTEAVTVANLVASGGAGVFQPLDADLTALAAAGNSTTLSAVTAAYTTAEASKLAGIETGATADQTASEVPIVDSGALFIATNVETALAEVKAIADSAAGGGVTTTGTPVANDFARFTAASTIEGRSYSEVRADLDLEVGVDVQAYSAVLAGTTASYTTAEASKLDGIEALADVTDTTNVTAAGALMDSEVDADIKTLSLPANTTISAFGASLVDDADNTAARTTLGLGTIATQASNNVAITGGAISGITDLAIADGGTGASTALAAVQNLRTAPATVAGTTDTLAAADDNTVILYTSATKPTVTLANIATGFECVLVALGAQGLSVAAGGMSYANSFTPKLTVAQGEALYVKQTAASTFIILGGTAT